MFRIIIMYIITYTIHHRIHRRSMHHRGICLQRSDWRVATTDAHIQRNLPKFIFWVWCAARVWKRVRGWQIRTSSSIGSKCIRAYRLAPVLAACSPLPILLLSVVFFHVGQHASGAHPNSLSPIAPMSSAYSCSHLQWNHIAHSLQYITSVMSLEKARTGSE